MKPLVTITITLCLLFLSSCRTSNSVVSDGFLQKRKYTKGYYLSLRKQPPRDHTARLITVPTVSCSNTPVIANNTQPVVPADSSPAPPTLASLSSPPIQTPTSSATAPSVTHSYSPLPIAPIPPLGIPSNRPLDPLSVIGLIFSLFIPVYFFLELVLTIRTIPLVGFGWLLLLSWVLGLMFSIAGMARTFGKRSRWKGKVFALSGLVLSIAIPVSFVVLAVMIASGF